LKKFLRWWFTESKIYFPHGMVIFLFLIFIQNHLPNIIYAIGFGLVGLITIIGSRFVEEN
jgi:hypothetical protein